MGVVLVSSTMSEYNYEESTHDDNVNLEEILPALKYTTSGIAKASQLVDATPTVNLNVDTTATNE